MQSEYFQYENESTWTDLGAGVQRKIMGFNADLMMVKVKFESGAIGVMHHHPHTQVSFIESGVFEATIGEQVTTLKSGDGYFVPPNVLHGVVCRQAGVLVDSFNPVREDFLG
ncbi:cupin domain-containing protein [Pedobacter sp. HMF7647]|uniref:Cupin domain-containing protein n=1 Tax=Hufsiella arboris TaxID=2695275 RepID=A0A7K1Y5W9_9SPHI|nr:cupin domain-containing protein [Hufsiella arboris]MXV49499.1 cupin domain-containing protein [Hufsiella arboris]